MSLSIGRRGATALVATAALAGCATARQPAPAPAAHFVLVHGAWHGAWCWSHVVPLLRARGHGVTAVDLPGRWRSPEEMASLQADDYVEAVDQVLRTVSGPVVLVGHSLGGATISLAAQRSPERVRRLVYLAAFLVPDGQVVGALAAADKQSRVGSAVRRDSAGTGSRLEPERARDVFYPDCSEQDVRMALQLLSSEPAAMGRTTMRLTPERFGRVDRAYIECLQDRAISIGAQRAMQAALPCREVVTMDCSHSPFLSRPRELADILLRMA